MNKLDLQNYLKNLIGFSTRRKIVVIESDDWGSIRTRSKKDYDEMVNKGLELDNNPYTMYDSLESNTDLERLFDVLTTYRDKNGRNPVFTPMYIMGNPDFDKIESENFANYHFEHFLDTCKKYPNRESVKELIEQGIQQKVFLPELHGREHINVPRWLRALQLGNEGILLQFKYRSIGASQFKGIPLPMHLEACDPEFPADDIPINESIKQATRLFEKTFGYKASHFIEPNAYGIREFESVLKENGIKYLLRAKITNYSLYNNKKTRPYLHWIGKKNNYGQIYLTRNCTFEPHRPLDLKDVVGSCLKEIEIAFKMNKPAVIISHRASYIGSISEKNQINGLTKLKELLTGIVTKWPDVEFMTSTELGNYIIKAENV